MEACDPGGGDRARATDLRPKAHLRDLQPRGRGIAVHSLSADGHERGNDRSHLRTSGARRAGLRARPARQVRRKLNGSKRGRAMRTRTITLAAAATAFAAITLLAAAGRVFARAITFRCLRISL